MINLSVGQPYPLPTPPPPHEGASANFLSKSGNILQININNLSKEEIFALKKGKIKAGFLSKNGEIMWLFTFFDKKGAVFTLDAPFDVRLITADLLALHSITNQLQRLVIDIHVIDRGILRVLRSVTMTNELTINFLAAAQDQFTMLKNNDQLNHWLMKSPDQLTKQARMYELGK